MNGTRILVYDYVSYQNKVYKVQGMFMDDSICIVELYNKKNHHYVKKYEVVKLSEDEIIKYLSSLPLSEKFKNKSEITEAIIKNLNLYSLLISQDYLKNHLGDENIHKDYKDKLEELDILINYLKESTFS